MIAGPPGMRARAALRSSGSSLPRLVPRCCWPEDNPPAGGYGEVEKVAMRSARATTGTAGDHRIQAPAAATGLATAPVLPLCVPITSSTSCDQPIFVDHATDVSLFSDAVQVEVDWVGERLQRRGAVQGVRKST